jgi:hypothetical protein
MAIVASITLAEISQLVDLGGIVTNILSECAIALGVLVWAAVRGVFKNGLMFDPLLRKGSYT